MAQNLDSAIVKDFTANGITTLATAGKYCDKNIEINVNVPVQPTQFTNYYDPANVTLKMNTYCSSADGFQTAADNEVNYLLIPYQHKANEPFALRMRGIGTVRSKLGFTMMGADGVTPNTWGQLSSVSRTCDEYGDMVLTFSGNYISKDWSYFYLNFQYTGASSATTALTGPIVTINEPIGNGGYAG